jgi:hypothetical protein
MASIFLFKGSLPLLGLPRAVEKSQSILGLILLTGKYGPAGYISELGLFISKQVDFPLEIIELIDLLHLNLPHYSKNLLYQKTLSAAILEGKIWDLREMVRD